MSRRTPPSDPARTATLPHRRRLLQALGVLGMAALAGPARTDHPPSRVPARGASRPGDDWCGAPDGSPLLVPGGDGLFGRPWRRTARRSSFAHGGHGHRHRGALADGVRRHARTAYANPTLACSAASACGSARQRPRRADDRALARPRPSTRRTMAPASRSWCRPADATTTISTCATAPGCTGTTRIRTARTARQAYGGLYGLDRGRRRRRERVARGARPHARRDRDSAGAAGPPRRASPTRRRQRTCTHGFLGDEVFVNGARCPYLDVGHAPLPLPHAECLQRADAAARASAPPAGRVALHADRQRRRAAAGAGSVHASSSLARPNASTCWSTCRDAAVGEHRAAGNAGVRPDACRDARPRRRPAATAPRCRRPARRARGPKARRARLLELRVRERVAYGRRVPARLSHDRAHRHRRRGRAAVPPRLRQGPLADQRPRVRRWARRRSTSRATRVETWLLRNYHTSMPHAMHLHGVRVRGARARNQSRRCSPRSPSTTAGRLATDLGRKDTVLVWPGESRAHRDRLHHPFPGAQTYMFHCHNLEHEDGGMMLGFRVVAG